MVQLQSASRLTIAAEFGISTDVENADGTLIPNGFKVVFKTAIGRWSLTTTQALQVAGMENTHTYTIIAHHRNNWDDVTEVRINGKQYSIVSTNQDPFQNPTAYDQVVIREVNV